MDGDTGDTGATERLFERWEAPTGRLGEIAGHLNVLHAELVDMTVELLASRR